MVVVNTVSLREMFNSPPSKKKLSFLIARSVYDDIENMSNHHPGILNVATRLTHFVTPLLPSGHSTFLDLVLSQAMTEWHAHYIDHGLSKAYVAYCNSILKDLPEIFNYSVTGKSGNKPFLLTTWDCTKESLSDWLTGNAISNCEITYKETVMRISPRESGFLIASRVFSRHELSFWGVGSELSNFTNRCEE